MTKFSIEKTGTGLYVLLLPVCSADVLNFVLSPDVPYIWMLNLRSESLNECVVPEMKKMFPRAQDKVIYRGCAEFDFGLSRADFLTELAAQADFDHWPWDGLTLIQAYRPLPDGFSPDSVTARSQRNVFQTLNIYLRFNLPHSDEYAAVEAWDPEVLKHVIQRVKPYFEPREGYSHYYREREILYTQNTAIRPQAGETCDRPVKYIMPQVITLA